MVDNIMIHSCDNCRHLELSIEEGKLSIFVCLKTKKHDIKNIKSLNDCEFFECLVKNS